MIVFRSKMESWFDEMVAPHHYYLITRGRSNATSHHPNTECAPHCPLEVGGNIGQQHKQRLMTQMNQIGSIVVVIIASTRSTAKQKQA